MTEMRQMSQINTTALDTTINVLKTKIKFPNKQLNTLIFLDVKKVRKVRKHQRKSISMQTMFLALIFCTLSFTCSICFTHGLFLSLISDWLLPSTVTCVWWCEAFRRWTVKPSPAPCWESSGKIQKPATSFWHWSAVEGDEALPPAVAWHCLRLFVFVYVCVCVAVWVSVSVRYAKVFVSGMFTLRWQIFKIQQKLSPYILDFKNGFRKWALVL